MMKRILAFLMLLCSCSVWTSAAEDGDVALRNRLKRLFLDLHSIERRLQAALEDIDFASNRIVAVAKDLYSEESERMIKGRALTTVSSYGTSSDIDFVTACATNRDYWYSASIGVIKMLGPTTNAVETVDSLMHITAMTNGVDELESDKSYVIAALLNRAMKDDASQQVKNLSWNYAMSFASNHVDTIMVTDMALSRFDSTFQNSRRRLALLRYLQPLETIPDLQRYVSDEINKIEALSEDQINE